MSLPDLEGGSRPGDGTVVRPDGCVELAGRLGDGRPVDLTSAGPATTTVKGFACGTTSGRTRGSERSLIELEVAFLADGQEAATTSALLGVVRGRVVPSSARA